MSTMTDAQGIVRRAPYSPAWPPAGEPQAPTEETGLTAADIIRALKQRKLLLVIMFAVLYALVLATTVAVWKWLPGFTANALLQLHPPQEDPLMPAEALVAPNIMDLLVQTEAMRIKRPDILQDVLSLPEVKATNFYKWYSSFDKAVEDLQDLIRVSPIPDTMLISLSLSCRDRDEAVLIVKKLAERATQSYREEAGYRGQQALEDLKRTRDTVKRELEQRQRELENFRKGHDVGAIETEAATLGQKIADQNWAVNSYMARQAELQAQLNIVGGRDPRQLPITPEDRVIVEADPLLRLYRQQVESLDIRINAAKKHTIGENNRFMKELLAQRDGYYERERARREELLDDLRERRVQSIREELARVQAVLGTLLEQLETYEARLATVDNARVKYEAMVKEEERIQKNLEGLEEKVTQQQHAAGSEQRRARLTIVQEPKRPVWPSRPNLPVYLGGGLLLSLLGAVGFVFLREVTDKYIRTPIDVARYGRLSVLGCIPALDDEEAEVEEIEKATRQAPHSLVSEAFRQVRANLLFSGPHESQHSVLITSPGAGNGKTATAINLAVTLAQAGERVLLIDCNFRRPGLRRAFPELRPEGLSNILVGQGKAEDLIYQSSVPNLDLLGSGPMPPTPSELLGSRYMQELIALVKSKYERVILDGPPALLVSDALVLSRLVDGVILVAQASENTKGALRRAREQLLRINARVQGAILNGVRARPGGYYREQYREFYEYGADETIPPELPGPFNVGTSDPK
jgi:succinoglycan biosynthesis transport protein ExoP